MSINDPLGDFLTRIRNAQMRQRKTVEAPASKMLVAVAEILKQEGFINDFELVDTTPRKTLKVDLKWVNGQAAIHAARRVSKPGIRKYVGYRDIPQVRKGIGMTVLSTPQGLMTGVKAKAAKLGGEILFIVY